MGKYEFTVTFKSNLTNLEISANVNFSHEVYELDYLKYYAYKSTIDGKGFSMAEWKIISIINAMGDEVLKLW